MSAELLQSYVNATAPGDAPFIAQCWEEAGDLVRAYIGDVEPFTVPDAVRQRATLEVGAELFHRRNAPGGITQFATFDGASPVRMARDPMVPAYPLLDRYLPGGLA